MKKTTLSLILLLSLLSLTTHASVSAPSVSTFSSKTERKLLEPYIRSIQLGEIPQKDLVHLYTILENTSEHYIHNMNGAKNNTVYISKDGHTEGVYDESGDLVKDGINDGSYNYYHPRKEPLNHYYLDIHPWIILGNTPQDTTNKSERVFSYLSDLEGGLKKALDLNLRNEINYSRDFDKGQVYVLAFFLRIIEKSNNSKILELFKKDKVTDTDLVDSLVRLEQGFYRVYSIPTKK